MKKIIVLCLIAAILLLSGCAAQTPSDPDGGILSEPDAETPSESDGGTPSESDGGTPSESDGTPSDTDPFRRFGYTEADLASVIFTDLQKEITVDLSANHALKAGLMNLKYDPDQTATTDSGEAVYELKLNGKSLYLYSENVAAYDGSALYACQGFDALAYLGGALAGEPTELSGFSADATVKVKNAQGLVAEVEDNAEFFAELGKAKLVRLANAADYTVPSATYTVAVGEEGIGIHGRYVKLGADLYAVTEGDFAFLSDYTFSSSSGGFLPWI